MPILTMDQTVAYAKQAGFKGQGLIDICAIAKAESGLSTDVVNSIGATGILQIYLAVHPTVSSAQAKDPAYSFRYAYGLSNGGTNFCAWQSYKCSACGCCNGPTCWDGHYAQYLPEAQAAVNNAGGGGGLITFCPPSDGSVASCKTNCGCVYKGNQSMIDACNAQCVSANGGVSVGVNPTAVNPIISALGGATAGWLTNPSRIFKMVGGILCVGASLWLLATPEAAPILNGITKLPKKLL